MNMSVGKTPQVLQFLQRGKQRQLRRHIKERDQEALNGLQQEARINQALEGDKPQSNLMFGLGLFAGSLFKAAYQAHRQDTLRGQAAASAASQRMGEQSAGMLGAMSASNTGSVGMMLGTLYQPLPFGGGGAGMGMGMLGGMLGGLGGMGMMPSMMGMPNIMGGMGGMGITPLPNMPVPLGMGMGVGNPALEQQIAQMASIIEQQRQGMAKLFEMIQQRTSSGDNTGGTENSDTIKPAYQVGNYLMPPSIAEKIKNWDKQYHADGTTIDDKFKIREELEKYLTYNQSAINDHNKDVFTLPLDEVKIQELVDNILPKGELYPYNELKSIGLGDFSSKSFIKHVDKPAINDVIHIIEKAGGTENATLGEIISSDNSNVPQYIKELGQAISKDQLEVLKDMPLQQLRDSLKFASEQKPNEVKGYDDNPIVILNAITKEGEENNIVSGKFSASEFPSQNFMNILGVTNSTDPDKISVNFDRVNVSELALNSSIQNNDGGTISLRYKGEDRNIKLSQVHADTLNAGVGDTHTNETALQTSAKELLESVKKLHGLLKSDTKDHKAIKEATVDLNKKYETYNGIKNPPAQT